MTVLTQEELRRLFYYNPETGDFIRRVKVSSNTNVGDIAGSYSHGYKMISINNKRYAAHRLAFLYVQGELPKKGLEIDHINHDKGDNTWHNLRIVTHQENQKNCSLSRNNKSRCVGVNWHKGTNKWAAAIMTNGKSKFLGLFEEKNDAIEARMAANKRFGYHANHGQQKGIT